MNTPVTNGKASPAPMGGLKQQTGGRSPLIRKSIDHIYGAKNLPSDHIGNVVNNSYMEEAAILL